MSKTPVLQNWEIDKVIPYKNNVKEHPPEQIETLAKQIQEFGFDQPIVVDVSGVIIKGHGRRLAAIHLGRKFVPVIVRDDLTKAQVNAARLADNQVVSNQYDTNAMAAELREIESMGEVDIAMLGFDQKELDLMMRDLDSTDIDADAITDDVAGDVEAQQQQNQELSDELSSGEVGVAQALGFKKVNAEDELPINYFIAGLEAQYGMAGAAALAAFAREWLDE